MFYTINRRTLNGIALCLVLALLITVGGVWGSRYSIATNGNWGLNFQKDGQTPTGNATPDFLKTYGACFVGDTTQKVLYLTFDAGYENGYTASILDTLKKHQVPAAFFLVGNYLDTAPELVRRMVEEGHLVGNHTNRHPDMSAIADIHSFQKELTDLEAKFKTVTEKDLPKFYRPPQGKYSEENLKHAHELGYKTVFWSLAYVDWYNDRQPTREQALSKLLPRIHNGAVILLHSTSKTNAEILDEFLTTLKADGYTFAPLTELNV